MRNLLKECATAVSLTESMIMMILSTVVMVAAYPLINTGENLAEYDISSINCIKAEQANLGTLSCIDAVNACKYDRGKSCKTLIFLAEYGMDLNEKLSARNILKVSCDQGSKVACKYFVDSCNFEAANCDIKGSDSDLKYYLNLTAVNINSGKPIVKDIVNKYLDLGYANIQTITDIACCNPDFNLACDLQGLKSCPDKSSNKIN